MNDTQTTEPKPDDLVIRISSEMRWALVGFIWGVAASNIIWIAWQIGALP